MWRLEKETKKEKVYRNSVTNSECKQALSYVDKEGNTWWEFTDLVAMPFTRNFAATKITSLYTAGLTTEDVIQFISKQKAILKSKDSGEKYEQAYAEILDFENKVKNASDPIRQMSSLVCVYFTINDEPIDAFLNDTQLQKISLLEADANMHSFFLKRQIVLIENYKTFLSSISQIVSNPISA